MKKKLYILTNILLILVQAVFALPEGKINSGSLNGKVTDNKTNEPLPGVSIYFPDLKIGTQTNSDGTYSIKDLPATNLLVQVSFVGYQAVNRQVDLSSTKNMDFKLKESVTEINEVVVTGQPGVVEQKRIPAPIKVVPRSELLQNASTNIIDAIAREPGVSEITTGAGISKPVIRGLGYNRVVVVNNGVRQEGQQWGDEHGIEIDEYDVDHVEILKGPASLAYGSDAMAGVINMISAPTLPNGSIKGNIISNYQTNNGLIGYSANIAGNKSGFVWDARFSQKLAHAYENKYDGPVYNSGFRENAASALLGINRSWGFSHLTLSMYYLEPGMVEGERDSLTGKFVKEVTLANGETSTELATSSDFNSYHPEAPFQKINHYKAVWNNNIYFGKGNLQTIIGFQQNRRKEFEDPDNYGLYFQLNTLNYDFKYTLSDINGWKFTTGVNGMRQQSKNKGTEFLVPAYKLFDFGVYGIVNKNLGRFDLSGGLRYDVRSENADALYLNGDEEKTVASDPDAEQRFSAFDKTFDGVSGSIGSTYQISDQVYTKLNVSRGFRAPNIAELGSNGEHEGTFRYEIGNTSLKPETSMQFDWGIGLNSKHVSAEVNLFKNDVNHYIFIHKLGNDSMIDDVPVYKFSDGKARLYGGEVSLDIHPHPMDWLHFENTFSYTRGTLKDQPDSASNLPLIPAPRWTSEIRANIKRVAPWMQNAYVSFGIDQNWKQNHYFEAYGTETATPGYMLLNAGLGTDFTYKRKTVCSFFISAGNLTDKAYQSHLSRLKYAGTNYATGREGVFNMGRNFSFKLLIPIG